MLTICGPSTRHVSRNSLNLALASLLGLVAAPLLRLPMVGWMDASPRANLSSGIDLAQSKLAEDLRHALPTACVCAWSARACCSSIWRSAPGAATALAPAARRRACPAVCSGGATLNDVFQAACYTTAGAAGKGGVVSMLLRLSQAASDTGIAESVELEASFAVSEGP